MSGGSFNYLYVKDAEGLLAARDDLDAMERELADLVAEGVPGADVALLRTRAISAACARLRAECDALNLGANGVTHVWRSVEWWRSGDGNRDQVVDALRRFKEELPK